MSTKSLLNLGLVFLVLISSPRSVYAENAGARVVTVAGAVVIGLKKLRPGDSVSVGQTIRTGRNSKAKILMPDGSIVDLGSRTRFTVKQAGAAGGAAKIDAKVEEGTIRTLVPKLKTGKGFYRIRTNTSVLAIRGTEFVVQVVKTGTRVDETVSLAEGTISSTTGTGGQTRKGSLTKLKQLKVRATLQGNKVVFDPGQAGAYSVGSISQSQMNSLLVSTRIVDATFRNQVEVDEQPAPKEGNSTEDSLNVPFDGNQEIPKDIDDARGSGDSSDSRDAVRDRIPEDRDNIGLDGVTENPDRGTGGGSSSSSSGVDAGGTANGSVNVEIEFDI